MSESATHLARKRANARDLQSIVRTMKALAASNIGQFEKAAASLEDYSHSVELGISACLRGQSKGPKPEPKREPKSGRKLVTAIIFGSDQGLVGQFNDVVVNHAEKIRSEQHEKSQFWAVGERASSRLEEMGLAPTTRFEVPISVKSINSLIGKILLTYEKSAANSDLYLFYNKASSATLYSPMCLKLLPFNFTEDKTLSEVKWPTPCVPQILGPETFRALIREYLYISMFRACAESLKAENASRLAAMQRADKNIGELLENLTNRFNHLRQSQIDEELFEVVSGFESLAKKPIEKERIKNEN